MYSEVLKQAGHQSDDEEDEDDIFSIDSFSTIAIPETGDKFKYFYQSIGRALNKCASPITSVFRRPSPAELLRCLTKLCPGDDVKKPSDVRDYICRVPLFVPVLYALVEQCR